MNCRSSSKMVAIDQFLEELCPLRDIWYIALNCHTKIQIEFEFGSDPLIFHKVMALGFRTKSRIISFLDLFSLCLKIFILYLVHCFAIPGYRLSLSLI
jgi:hypothetical protein